MNSPLCYDCEDSTDLNCCSTADELEKLNEETLKSMKYDYVFENDYTDRQKNNLNTIISLLDYRGL
jgi:guanylate kinase